MKTNTLLHKTPLACLILLIMSLASLCAQSPKVIQKTMKASPNVEFSFVSKMTDVTIDTWDKPEIAIRVEINAQTTSNDLDILYEKFKVETQEGFGKVSIVAELDDYKNYSTSNDNTKIIFKDGTKLTGIKNLQINITLQIPKTAKVQIDHKFGELTLSDISGDVDLNFRHGDLTAHNLTGNSFAEIAHADVHIASLKKANIEVKHSDVEIRKVRHLTLDASYCDITIEDADTLITAQKHNEFNIEEVGYLRMDEKYSDIEIDHLFDFGKFDLDFSELVIKSLDEAFQNLDFDGEMSELKIDLDELKNFQFNFEGDFGDITLPHNISITEDKKDGSHRIVVGSKGDGSKAKINIISKHGEVILK